MVSPSSNSPSKVPQHFLPNVNTILQSTVPQCLNNKGYSDTIYNLGKLLKICFYYYFVEVLTTAVQPNVSVTRCYLNTPRVHLCPTHFLFLLYL